MPKLLLYILISLVHISGYGQLYELRVQITNIEEIKGKARMAVFNDAELFKKKERPVDSAVLEIQTNSISHSFKLKKGIYAVAVYQDENSDGELNKRAMGIPVEGVGFSNYSKKKLRPPDFKESSFLLLADTTVQIPIFYDNKEP